MLVSAADERARVGTEGSASCVSRDLRPQSGFEFHQESKYGHGISVVLPHCVVRAEYLVHRCGAVRTAFE